LTASGNKLEYNLPRFEGDQEVTILELIPIDASRGS